MMQSMTGYGQGRANHNDLILEVEIRSLNGKQSDVRFKLPTRYREADAALKRRVREVAQRGKIEVTVERKDNRGGNLGQVINETSYKNYLQQLQQLHPESKAPAEFAGAILRIPGVVGEDESAFEEAEMTALHEALQRALDDFLAFRKDEGKALEEELLNHVADIERAIPAVEQYESARNQHMRERLNRLIEEHATGTATDQNRLEQEVIYYLEKMDIAEEKSRLKQHCIYFREKIQDDEIEKGRRLSFITQEMGREINTLGAKAYSSDIQRQVVEMKDALEKIKEQLANIV